MREAFIREIRAPLSIISVSKRKRRGLKRLSVTSRRRVSAHTFPKELMEEEGGVHLGGARRWEGGARKLVVGRAALSLVPGIPHSSATPFARAPGRQDK